jgi:hypothetical protein
MAAQALEHGIARSSEARKMLKLTGNTTCIL